MISFRTRKVVIGAAVVLLLVAVVVWRGCHKAAGEEEAGDITASVQVAKAERGAIANDITAVATLTPQRQADLMPKVSAQIVSMPLLVNRVVGAGDLLAVLEARDLSAQRAEAQAALQEAEAGVQTTANGAVPLTNAQDRKSVRDAQATVDNARKTYERRKVLFDQGGISKKDLEASQLAVTMAEDDLRAAESAAALHGRVTNPGDVRIAEAKARGARDRLANLDALHQRARAVRGRHHRAVPASGRLRESIDEDADDRRRVHAHREDGGFRLRRRDAACRQSCARGARRCKRARR